MPESVHWGDEDFYTSSKENLIQALKAKKGSCCHFATLTQYLHLRNNMYSDMIYSDVHVESDSDENIGHVFNLLFLGNEEKKWTFIDTMWEKNFLKLRERNRFSFVTLEDMQKEYMLLGLRKIDGVSISEFKNKFGKNPVFIYKNELNELVENGFLRIDLDFIKLTDKGIDFANLVWEKFI